MHSVHMSHGHCKLKATTSIITIIFTVCMKNKTAVQIIITVCMKNKTACSITSTVHEKQNSSER